MGRSEGTFEEMGFDRGRRGRGRDKRDRFGEDEFDPFSGAQDRSAGGDRFGGGGAERPSEDRFGGAGARGGGDSRGGMPAQVVGELD